MEKIETIEDLTKDRKKIHKEIMEQKGAIKMLQKDRDEKVDEMTILANKRQDVQREMRNKVKILDKK
jgi:hypothetical protein